MRMIFFNIGGFLKWLNFDIMTFKTRSKKWVVKYGMIWQPNVDPSNVGELW